MNSRFSTFNILASLLLNPSSLAFVGPSLFYSYEKTFFDETDFCKPIDIVDELPHHYYILHNTNHLSEAEIFLFGVFHDKREYYSLVSYFVNAIGKKDDVLLTEGQDRTDELICSSICRDHQRWVLSYKSAENHDPNFPCFNITDAIHLKFSDDFVCKGWDNEMLISEYYEAQKNYDALYNISENIFFSEFNKLETILTNKINQSHDALNKLLIAILLQLKAGINSEIYQKKLAEFVKGDLLLLKKVETEIKKFGALKNSSDNKIKTDFLKISEQLKEIMITFVNQARDKLAEENEKNKTDPFRVKKRNQSAMQAIDENRKPGRRIFLELGQYHLISDRKFSVSTLFALKPKDLQLEFRKYLKDKPHVVLIPKF